ncbi:MAG: PorT family protein, partial [Saprospiraceae bacterium]|nr:PorT family protein [Saprospiraceae bacterium]
YYNFSADLEKDVNQDTELNLSEKTTIQQVKLPVNVGFNLTGEGGLLKLHALGGITPTFVTGVNERPDFALSKDDLNPFTLGANVGLGLDVWFLTANVGYEIGLNDFFKDSEGKNNVLTLNVGIKF